MKKIAMLLVLLIITVLAGCGNAAPAGSSTAGNTGNHSTSTSTSTAANQTLGDLKNTQNFTKQALHHIFEGELNKRDKVVGYHYEGMASAKARVEDGTRSAPDKNGVYTGKVYIGNKLKDGNNGFSTFFPRSWTAQQVVDAINYAWENRRQRTGAQYTGKTKEGLSITFYADDRTGKIATAYPMYTK